MNSPRNRLKESSERQVLSLFRKVFHDFPRGKIVKTEAPDFTIKVSSKKAIGIELTRLIAINSTVISPWPQEKHLADMIKKILERKDEKLILYKKNWLSAYWLVIYILYPENFSVNEKSNLLCTNFSCGFDRVFVLNLVRHDVIELSLK